MSFTRSPTGSVSSPNDPTSSPEPPRWSRYVALGDSFTEGLWDVPGGAPPERTTAGDPDLPCRGWADLLAAHLDDRRRALGGTGPGGTDDDGPAPVRYANLAVRGRLLGPILRDQVPEALRLGADLVSVVGGGNDMLRPTADPDEMAAGLEQAVARLRAAGVDVLLATGMDAKDSPLVRRTRTRVGIFNAHIWTIAQRHGAHVVDLWGMRSLRDWRMWAPDRIHLTTEGHRRVAQGALVALGLRPDDEAWDDPLTPLPPSPRVERLRADAEWFRRHAYPWATRRFRGRSSGDRRVPKRPELTPVR